MQPSSFLELNPRGTPDFPVELYIVNESHPRYNMQFHWHSDIEIVHISKGTLDLTLNDTHYNLNAGDSIIVPGGVVHGAVPDCCEYECLRFDKSILYATPGIKKLVKTELLYPVKFADSKDIERLFLLMCEKAPNQLALMSLLFLIVEKTIEKQDGTTVTNEEKIERIKPAITFIEDNYSRHITIDELSGECLMSNNYFIRYFKEVTNQTPIEFLNKFRIESACAMLLSGASVTETAFACGFNDLSYFIHMFKKNVGLSPKKYAIRG